MSLPTPRPGLVIRYAFLWRSEAEIGQDEGRKDRPCAIVVAARKDADDGISTVVAPITHSLPSAPDASLEIPANVARDIGLDDRPHWIRLDELNRFIWPGFDLRPIPGRDEVAYGLLPRALFERLRSAILERQRQGSARPPIGRD